MKTPKNRKDATEQEQYEIKQIRKKKFRDKEEAYLVAVQQEWL